jgi:hypothetical protein
MTNWPAAGYGCGHPDCADFLGISFDEMADHVSDVHDGDWAECDVRPG